MLPRCGPAASNTPYKHGIIAGCTSPSRAAVTRSYLFCAQRQAPQPLERSFSAAPTALTLPLLAPLLLRVQAVRLAWRVYAPHVVPGIADGRGICIPNCEVHNEDAAWS